MKLFNNDFTRLNAITSLLAVALLGGIALSLKLWFPIARSFPRVPLIVDLPPTVVVPLEWVLSSLLIVALVASLLTRRRMPLTVVIVSLVILALLDQTRLQPWVYQYLVMFIVLAIYDRVRDNASFSLFALQMIVVTLYFWSGVQKLNYSFSHELLPQLLQNHLTLSSSQWSTVGISVSMIEIFTGCGLLLRKTRKLCVCVALAMHGLILGLLIVQHRNSVVWIWNVALMLLVVVLFWRSDFSIRQIVNGKLFSRSALVILGLYSMLPMLSFWGWWDMYLSGALYSANTPVAVVRVEGQALEKLPQAAKAVTFTTTKGELMLPLFEWSMSELNVPPYPELRVFKQVAREICRVTDNEAELIVKGRPAIIDGSYQVTRTTLRLCGK